MSEAEEAAACPGQGLAAVLETVSPPVEPSGEAAEDGVGVGRLDDAAFWGETTGAFDKADARVIRALSFLWTKVSRPAQQPPEGEWRQWLLIGGRGAGKTRAGAEWVKAMVLGQASAAGRRHRRVALVAETLADAREVMIDGESGLIRVCEGMRLAYEPSRRRIVFPNGAVAQVFSSEDPDSLRGYQFDAAWGDELAKWTYAQETFDNLQLGLRLGRAPRALFTTTPRAIPLLKRLISDPQSAITHMRSAENAANLAPGFLAAMEARYGGTRLGRQELDGELIEAREDGLFDLKSIEGKRVRAAPELRRVVVAVDPPASSNAKSDACGIVAAGKGEDGTIYVLADASRKAVKPHEWANATIALYRRLKADRIVAEANMGGEMVEAVIRAAEPDAAVRCVRASRGKWLRAEPVAALYERGRVRHAGRFPELEEEMADFGPDGLSGGRSPDRLDALVWAVNALTESGQDPRIRGL